LEDALVEHRAGAIRRWQQVLRQRDGSTPRGPYRGPTLPQPTLTHHGRLWTRDLFDQDFCGRRRTTVDGPFSFGTKRPWVQIPPARLKLQVAGVAWPHSGVAWQCAERPNIARGPFVAARCSGVTSTYASRALPSTPPSSPGAKRSLDRPLPEVRHHRPASA
jgi:hypothetical protein